MSYTLGDIIFKGQYGPKQLSTQHAARYANTALVNGGTVLQKTGNELIGLSFEIYLHFSFADVASSILAFETARESGAALPLSSDEGEQFGDFVILSYSVTRSRTNATGETVEATISLSLSEYTDPDPAATALREATRGALALSVNSPTAAVVESLPPTDLGAVVLSSISANSAATDAAELISLAEVPEADTASLLSRASATYSKGREEIENVIKKLTDTQTLAARVPGMLEAAQGAASVFSSAAQAAAAGDLNNSKAQSLNALAATANMSTIGRPLFIDQITRRG